MATGGWGGRTGGRCEPASRWIKLCPRHGVTLLCPAGWMILDSKRSEATTGVLTHGTFVGGSPLISSLASIPEFPAPEYYRLYEVVSKPVRIDGTFAARILAGDEIGLVEEYFRERRW